MMKAVINKDNSFGGIFTEKYISSSTNLNGVLVEDLNLTNILPENLIKPIWNGGIWIEGATPEQISAFNSAKVPQSISRMNFKIQLLLKGISIDYIIEVINSLDDSVFSEIQKQIAIIKLNEATYFERTNPDLILISSLVGIEQDTLDSIFIDGNKD